MADNDNTPSLLDRGLSLIQNKQGMQGPGLVEKFLGSPVGQAARVPLDIYGLAHRLKGGGTPEQYFAQSPVATLAGHEAGLQDRLLTDPEFAGRYARAKLLGPQLSFLTDIMGGGMGGGGAAGPAPTAGPATRSPEGAPSMLHWGVGGEVAPPGSSVSPATTAPPVGAPTTFAERMRGALGPGVGFRGMGLEIPPVPPAPLKLNPNTAQGMGLKSGDTYGGRQVVIDYPKEPTAITTKKEVAGTLSSSLNDLEGALNKVGEYGPRTAGLNQFKKDHPMLSGGISPDWTTLLNWGDLNSTALMNMHVGARGSEGMMQHFIQDITAAGHQGSAQLHATITVLRKYLQNVQGGMEGDQALRQAGYGSDLSNQSTPAPATVTPSTTSSTRPAPTTTTTMPTMPSPGVVPTDLDTMAERIRARNQRRIGRVQ